jgi:hypothetical protein
MATWNPRMIVFLSESANCASDSLIDPTSFLMILKNTSSVDVSEIEGHSDEPDNN